MITTVIFDMNGVITDDEDLHELATQKTFEKVGLSITPDIYRQYCLGRTDASAFVDLIGNFHLKDQEVSSIINDKSILYQELIADNLKIYPGVIRLIENLCLKYTLALTTSSTFEEAQTVVNQLEIENLFKVIVSSNDVKRGKPDPEPYLLTAEKLGVSSDNCVVIEDSENGIRSAIAAGMKCIALPNTENRDKLTLAHCIVDDYSEITDELLQSL
ncbi:HAD family phosphatase [uncultured Maribacter sp.]|uniref:HAD family hydrolase n=1 Tax=uncultured Maribacter sp. TaxID=431308 RepID=UPI0030EC2013|tara:strand:+ start:48325 stop:48972 length:648 start_codon:yes stop_codon:yes gene_type:complete